MSEAELAARLSAHEHAFEGLLDLIPAKFYNPEDAANQWNKRKQTKEEAVQSKRAKLDPDQNSRQRKKVDSVTQTDLTATNGLPKNKQPNNKKQPKTVGNTTKKAGANVASEVSRKKGAAQEAKSNGVPEEVVNSNNDDSNEASINTADSEASTPNMPDPNRNITDLRAKLAAKIEALRSKRKARGSGADGAPTSRDAILEARRKKEEARKEKKKLEKEARKDAALEIQSEDDEPSAQASEEDDESSEDEVDGVSYGKVAFADGEQLNADGTVKNARKRKQQDPQSALQAALNKKARLAALPSEKQAKIADSDVWHKALLQADGEKVKDDVALLKKAVKRQEGLKKKSTKEWKERLASIAKSKAFKQKNREQNLKDRRESKGQKGGHKKGKQVGAYQGKKKGKSGF